MSPFGDTILDKGWWLGCSQLSILRPLVLASVLLSYTHRSLLWHTDEWYWAWFMHNTTHLLGSSFYQWFTLWSTLGYWAEDLLRMSWVEDTLVSTLCHSSQEVLWVSSHTLLYGHLELELIKSTLSLLLVSLLLFPGFSQLFLCFTLSINCNFNLIFCFYCSILFCYKGMETELRVAPLVLLLTISTHSSTILDLIPCPWALESGRC